MKVQQFGYLSPGAKALRSRDGIPPWGIHVCEVDSLGAPGDGDHSPFAQLLREAFALRAELEASC